MFLELSLQGGDACKKHLEGNSRVGPGHVGFRSPSPIGMFDIPRSRQRRSFFVEDPDLLYYFALSSSG